MGDVIDEIKWFVKWFVIIVGALAFILGMTYISGGGDTGDESETLNTTAIDVENVDGEIKRFTDPETNSTCYIYNPGKSDSSISCTNP